ALRTRPLPSGIRDRSNDRDEAEREPPAADLGSSSGGRPAALLVLAAAIACYVAAEIGVSNWLVRFLDAAPVAVATFGLSVFWTGLMLGRLVAARYSDRFDLAAVAIISSVIAGIAVAIGVAAPTPAIAIGAFAVAGFGFGPVFPLIIAIGGELYPTRVAAASGTLTGAAVVGSMLYPPLIGFLSVRYGIGLGILGTSVLAIAGAAAIAGATRLRARYVSVRP
ncbi:MAG: MFS transporter, partial [Chloroflexota bacterium]